MGSKIDYQILTWGPCVLKLKITDEFFELLKKESEASVKEELSYNHRLAGIIQKEYKLRDLNILQPYMQDLVNIYDQVWDKWRNADKPSKNKYLIKVKVNYSENKVKKLLSEKNISFLGIDFFSFITYLISLLK